VLGSGCNALQGQVGHWGTDGVISGQTGVPKSKLRARAGALEGEVVHKPKVCKVQNGGSPEDYTMKKKKKKKKEKVEEGLEVLFVGTASWSTD